MLTCCCAPPDCSFVDDDFNRANETPLAAPWLKQSGTDWNLTDEQIDALAAADYTYDLAFPGDPEDHRTNVVDVIFSEDGAVEVQTGKTDADNYFAAALTFVEGGCSFLTAGIRIVGAGPLGCTPGPSILDCVKVWGLETGVRYRLRVCLIPDAGGYGYATYDKIIALITFPEDPSRLPISCTLLVEGPAVGDYGGLKSSMPVVFDNFKEQYHRDSPEGEHRTCPRCHTNCEISRDSFATDEPCLWDVLAGSATRGGGVMTITADDSFIQHHIFHPGLRTTFQQSFDKTDNGVRLVMYHGNGYAVLEYGGGTYTLTLFDNDDNVLDEDEIDISPLTNDADEDLSCVICFARGVLSAQVTGHDGINLCVDAADAETDGAYWAAVGGDTGLEIKNWRMDKTFHVEDEDGPADNCDDCEVCPATCFDCCDSPNPAGAYIVDLGAGGWTFSDCVDPPTHSCDACDDAAGEFEVVSVNDCSWLYRNNNCDIPTCFVGSSPVFEVRLTLVNDGTGCKWKVVVIVTFTPGDPSDPNIYCLDEMGGSVKSGGVQATYYSGYLSGTDQCNTMPVTLTKSADVFETGGECPCRGDLPATITLEALA